MTLRRIVLKCLDHPKRQRTKAMPLPRVADPAVARGHRKKMKSGVIWKGKRLLLQPSNENPFSEPWLRLRCKRKSISLMLDLTFQLRKRMWVWPPVQTQKAKESRRKESAWIFLVTIGIARPNWGNSISKRRTKGWKRRSILKMRWAKQPLCRRTAALRILRFLYFGRRSCCCCSECYSWMLASSSFTMNTIHLIPGNTSHNQIWSYWEPSSTSMTKVNITTLCKTTILCTESSSFGVQSLSCFTSQVGQWTCREDYAIVSRIPIPSISTFSESIGGSVRHYTYPFLSMLHGQLLATLGQSERQSNYLTANRMAGYPGRWWKLCSSSLISGRLATI